VPGAEFERTEHARLQHGGGGAGAGMRASGGWVADKTARHCAARTSLQSEHAGWNPTRVGLGF
jgi:hypothetical protein